MILEDEMPENRYEEASIKIGKNTFITALVILASLIVTAGILTRVIPTGSYQYIMDEGVKRIIDGTFEFTSQARLPIWHWITAPIEVLFSDDGALVMVIIFFLLAVSTAFSLLEKSDIMSLVVSKVVRKFGGVKYLLLAVVVFLFMILGAVIGTFEENIALVPIIISLAYCLGWDSLVGLGMSMLASCFGFTAAITNPFSIAITQEISDLPLYSGSWYRIIIFAVYFLVIYTFLFLYARKIEKNPEKSLVYKDDEHLRMKYRDVTSLEHILTEKSPEDYNKIKKATGVFLGFIGGIIIFVIFTNFIPALTDLILPIIGLFFLLGGIVASIIVGINRKNRLKIIRDSIIGIAPGVVLILMAMSVKLIIEKGNIIDTILYYTSNSIKHTSPYIAVILILVLVLLLELFVGSSSAKAFLVMPIIAPLSDLVGVTRQTSVLAFCFGDGFSNIIYPTNPVLLICLGLTVVTYTKWFKWTIKLQILSLAIASVFLLIGVAIQYGPF